MNQGLLGGVQGVGAAEKGQRVPVMVIEALPGGYMLTEGATCGWQQQRRSVVPNLDVLLNTIAGWARDAEARELAGDGNVGRG